SLLHLDQLVRHQAMGLAMHRAGGFLARRLNQAEGLPGALVEPIVEVLDSELLLNLQVLLMSAFDRLRGQAIDLVMDIHVKRHSKSPCSLQSGLRILGVQRSHSKAPATSTVLVDLAMRWRVDQVVLEGVGRGARRVLMPIFPYRLMTCVCTVAWETWSSRAICLFASPRVIPFSTSTSRSVRPAGHTWLDLPFCRGWPAAESTASTARASRRRAATSSCSCRVTASGLSAGLQARSSLID